MQTSSDNEMFQTQGTHYATGGSLEMKLLMNTLSAMPWKDIVSHDEVRRKLTAALLERDNLILSDDILQINCSFIMNVLSEVSRLVGNISGYGDTVKLSNAITLCSLRGDGSAAASLYRTTFGTCTDIIDERERLYNKGSPEAISSAPAAELADAFCHLAMSAKNCEAVQRDSIEDKERITIMLEAVRHAAVAAGFACAAQEHDFRYQHAARVLATDEILRQFVDVVIRVLGPKQASRTTLAHGLNLDKRVAN